jgi:hypothetical protein
MLFGELVSIEMDILVKPLAAFSKNFWNQNHIYLEVSKVLTLNFV